MNSENSRVPPEKGAQPGTASNCPSRTYFGRDEIRSAANINFGKSPKQTTKSYAFGVYMSITIPPALAGCLAPPSLV